MAKLRASASDGMVGGIIVVICAALVTALMLAALVLITVFPYFIAALALFFVVIRRPPPLVQMDVLDPPEANRAISPPVAEYFRVCSTIDALYRRGFQDGVQTTKASGGTRFDNRSRLGKQINASLDQQESERDHLLQSIDAKRREQYRNIKAFNTVFRLWRWRAVLFKAAVASIVIAGVLLLALTLCGLMGVKWALAIGLGGSQFNIYMNYMVFVYIWYTALAFSSIYYSRNLSDQSMGPGWTTWLAVRSKWDPDFAELRARYWSETASTSREEFRSQGESSEAEAPKAEENSVAGWRSILEVTPWATVEDVKAAYRQAMKGYHTDRVVGLGEKIQAVAEAESKKLNAAYAEAKRELNF